MADLQKTIEIIFGGEDRVSKVIGKISAGLNDMATGVEAVSDPFASMHDGLLKVEAAFGALAVGGLALAVNAAKEFDGQFREITTLIGDTGEGVDRFKDDIRAYAADSTQSIADINSAVYQAISLGLDYRDSIDGLSKAEQLAVGGKADLTAATELLLGTMNAYGDGVDQAGRYSDVFFTIVKDGKTTIPELAQSMSQATSIAAAGKVPIETLGAAIAALTASGAPTSEAMTKIKAVIEGIIKPSGEAGKAAAALGIELSGQALAADGLDGMLRKIYDATGGNIDRMSELFGSSEALSAALVLGADKSGKFAAALGDMESSAGATAEAFAKMVDDINLREQTLANNLQLVMEGIGARLLDEYGEVVGGVTEVFRGLQAAIAGGAFDEVFIVLEGLGADLADTLKNLAENLPEALGAVDFSEFANSIRDLADEFGGIFSAFFADVDLSTPEGLATAIQKIVDAGTRLNEIVAGIIEGWQRWAGWLGTLTEKFAGMDTETARAVGSTLQLGKEINVLSGFVSSFSGVLDGFSHLLNVIAAQRMVALVASLSSASGAFVGLGGAIAAVSGTAAGQAGFLGLAAVAGYTAGTLLNEHVPAVGKAAQAVYHWVDSLVDFTDTQGAAERETAAFDGLINSLANSTDRFQYDLQGLRDQLQRMGKDVADLPDDKVFRLAAEADLLSVQAAHELIESRVPKDQVVTFQVEIEPEIDTTPITDELDSLADQTQSQRTLYITGALDSESLTAANAILESEIPKEIKRSIEPEINRDQLRLELDYFKVEADLAGKALEWTARVDVAQAESAAERVLAAFGSVNAAIESTGDTLVGLWGAMADLSLSDQMDLSRNIRDEMELRQKSFALQERLTEAEIALTEARAQSMEQGNGLIQITADGLEPELEAFMWRIIQKVQIRGVEENAEFLLGLT